MTTISPQELWTPENQARVNEVHDYWYFQSLDDVKAQMPEPQVVEVAGRAVRAVILPPRTQDVDETRTLVRLPEHQQPYTPGQYMSAAILRDVVAPNSRIVMLQNNSSKQDSHTIDAELENGLRDRGLVAMAEDKVRVLEKLGLSGVQLTGWSLGARMAIAMAEAGSDKINITHVNADETPSSLGRDVKGLKKAFLKSGTFGDQRTAVENAALPALSEHFAPVSLLIDYGKFGLYSLRSFNKILLPTMADSVRYSLGAALSESPDTRIKIGVVEGSQMTEDVEDLAYLADETIIYTGLNKHASVNNPFVQALMADHGLNPVAR